MIIEFIDYSVGSFSQLSDSLSMVHKMLEKAKTKSSNVLFFLQPEHIKFTVTED